MSDRVCVIYYECVSVCTDMSMYVRQYISYNACVSACECYCV